VPTGGNFTFGFTTAVVNSSGIIIATAPASWIIILPPTGDKASGARRRGPGVGGPLTTNDWAWTLAHRAQKH
jgi:hypothetical protein